MPISALPQETVRLLGPPLVFSSPVAVVKELVENAIDAHSTSVDVFISPNTVDSIEVRDNGDGIHRDDYSSLGLRGRTSKLRHFEDIQTVGSVTLGFRGDALASAIALSTLSITTRTAGEATASKLYFAEKGGVEKVERVSAPVGTSVRTTNLFARLPVRKQCALKEASKTISKIRDLLHSYAFARRDVKLTLRVFSQPRATATWSYSPGPHPSMRQAALQVFDAGLVSQCVERTNGRTQDATNGSSNELAGSFNIQGKGVYGIEALLPKPGVDPAKISGGAWFSVDSRPVSSSTETIKKLYSAFKVRLAKTIGSTSSATTMKSPFLAVNIKCPPRSYDPNIEPSKNEVLFTHPHHLIDAFEHFLDDIYAVSLPSCSVDETEGNRPPADQPRQASKAKPEAQGLRLLSPECTPVGSQPSLVIPGTMTPLDSRVRGLTCTHRPRKDQARTSPRMTVREVEELEQGSHYRTPPSSNEPKPGVLSDLHAASNPEPLIDIDQTCHKTSRGWKVDLSTHDDDDTASATSRPPPSRSESPPPSRSERRAQNSEESATNPKHDLNPWIIAKFNANRPQERGVPTQPLHQARLSEEGSPARALEAESHVKPPAPSMRPVVRLDADGLAAQQFLRPIPASRLGAHGVPGVAYRSPISTSRTGVSGAAQIAQHQTASQRERQSGSHASLQHGDGAYAQPRRSTRQRPGRREEDDNWFSGPPEVSTRRSKRLQSQRPGASDGTSTGRPGQTRSSQEQPDLSFDLGAIRRRQVLAENRRLRERPGEDTDIAVNSVGAGRVKPCMLRLKSAPTEQETRSLVQTIRIDRQDMSLAAAMRHGRYVPDAGADTGLNYSIGQAEFEEIQRRVRDLLSELGLNELDSECQVEFCVPSRLRR